MVRQVVLACVPTPRRQRQGDGLHPGAQGQVRQHSKPHIK